MKKSLIVILAALFSVETVAQTIQLREKIYPISFVSLFVDGRITDITDTESNIDEYNVIVKDGYITVNVLGYDPYKVKVGKLKGEGKIKDYPWDRADGFYSDIYEMYTGTHDENPIIIYYQINTDMFPEIVYSPKEGVTIMVWLYASAYDMMLQ
jgi:hypothetical protein